MVTKHEIAAADRRLPIAIAESAWAVLASVLAGVVLTGQALDD